MNKELTKNGTDLRHSIEKKAAIYSYFLETNAKAAYGRFGRDFRNMLHFENYLIEKCKRAYDLKSQQEKEVLKLVSELEYYEKNVRRKPILTVKDCKGLSIEAIEKAVNDVYRPTLEVINRPSLL